MFGVLFEEYKDKVLGIKYYDSIFNLELYKKIELLIEIVSNVIGMILFIMQYYYIGLVMYAIMLITIVIAEVIKKIPYIRKTFIQEKLQPVSSKRLDELKELLNKYLGEYNDEDIKTLIDFIKKEKDVNSFKLNFFEGSQKVMVYIIIPTITYTVTKIADNTTIDYLIVGGFVLILYAILFVVIISAAKSIINDIFYSDLSKYDLFVRDLEQLIIFKNYSTSN